jgi:hypothetical protein
MVKWRMVRQGIIIEEKLCKLGICKMHQNTTNAILFLLFYSELQIHTRRSSYASRHSQHPMTPALPHA